MLRIHFIQGFRKLIKDRFYSLINVAGLAIGLASCLLIINHPSGTQYGSDS